MFRLFLNTQAVALTVELCHTIALWVTYPVTKHRSLILLLGSLHSLMQQLRESYPMEYIVAQYQTSTIIAYKLATDNEGLCQSIGTGLFCKFKVHTIVRTITQQTTESRQVVWSANNEDIANASCHQHGYRIINHRFVVDRQHLLRYALCNWIETCAATTC